MKKIRLFVQVEIPLPIWVGQGAMCPICGVTSIPYPCYDEGEGTAVPHRLSYCDHELDANLVRLAIWSEPPVARVGGEPEEL